MSHFKKNRGVGCVVVTMFLFRVLFVISFYFRVAVLGNKTELNSLELNNEDFLNWTPPEKFKTKFPYYLSGYDYDNRPVVVLLWGKWDQVELIEGGGEQLKQFSRRNDQMIERFKKRYFSKHLNDSEAGSNDDEIVIIIDYDGISIQQFQSKKNLVFIMNFFGKLESCYEKFAYGYIVNSNTLADHLINLSKPFMSQFLERIEVYGTNSKIFIPQILKKIPRSELDAAYGGYKDFKPIKFYG